MCGLHICGNKAKHDMIYTHTLNSEIRFLHRSRLFVDTSFFVIWENIVIWVSSYTSPGGEASIAVPRAWLGHALFHEEYLEDFILRLHPTFSWQRWSHPSPSDPGIDFHDVFIKEGRTFSRPHKGFSWSGCSRYCFRGVAVQVGDSAKAQRSAYDWSNQGREPRSRVNYQIFQAIIWPHQVVQSLIWPLKSTFF